MTGTPVCLATRSAVRWRVPDSVVGMAESGTSWVAARRMVVHSIHHDRAVHLGQLAQARGRERDVEYEASGADGLDRLVVAQDDQRAGAPAEYAFQSFAQRGTRGDGSKRLAQLCLGAALISCQHATPAGASHRHSGDSVRARSARRRTAAGRWAASRAERTSPTSTVRIPTGTGPGSGGTNARSKPIRSASASRRWVPVTRRISPAKPTSPIATRPGGTGRSRTPLATASSRARSPAGSVSRAPPTVAA